MTNWRAISTVSVTVAALVLSATPAQANVRRFDDPKGDTKAHNDIRWVEVRNGGTDGGKRLVVRVRMAQIQPGDGMRIFVDTRAGNAGPEWRMSANADSEWILHRVNRWNAPGTVANCAGRVSMTDSKRTAFWRTSRKCLSIGDKVRVAVRVEETGSSQHDWAQSYRRFLGWVNH